MGTALHREDHPSATGAPSLSALNSQAITLQAGRRLQTSPKVLQREGRSWFCCRSGILGAKIENEVGPVVQFRWEYHTHRTRPGCFFPEHEEDLSPPHRKAHSVVRLQTPATTTQPRTLGPGLSELSPASPDRVAPQLAVWGRSSEPLKAASRPEDRESAHHQLRAAVREESNRAGVTLQREFVPLPGPC
ncbi:uncharacterized protein V5649_014085 [Rhynchonycteris naso]